VRSLTALLAASAGSLRIYIVGRFHKHQLKVRTHYFKPEPAEPPECSKPSEGGCRGLSLVFDVARHGHARVLSTGANPNNLKCASARLIFTRSPRPSSIASPHETLLLSRRTQAGRDWPVMPVRREQTGRTRIRVCDKRASGHQRAETRLSFSNRALGLAPEAIRTQTVTLVPFFGTEFRDSRGPNFGAFRIRPKLTSCETTHRKPD
jgi:hypothetical protein